MLMELGSSFLFQGSSQARPGRGVRRPRLRPLSVSSSSVSLKNLQPGIRSPLEIVETIQETEKWILSIIIIIIVIVIVIIVIIVIILKMPQAPKSTVKSVKWIPFCLRTLTTRRLPNTRPPHSARSVRGHLGQKRPKRWRLSWNVLKASRIGSLCH